MRYGILMSRVYERLMHEYTGFSYIYVCTHEIRKSSMRMSTIMYIQKSRIVTRMVMSLLLDLRCHDEVLMRCHDVVVSTKLRSAEKAKEILVKYIS